MAKKVQSPASETKAPEAKKCPITRAEFSEHAKPILVTIDGDKKVASPKEFSTGSFGWFMNEKLAMEIDGKVVKVQANILLTVVGSKEAE